MGQTVCRYRGGTDKTEFPCLFEEAPFLRDLLRSQCYVSLLETDYGCSNYKNDHTGLLMIHFAAVMALLVIWILSCVIQATDFTRSYVISMLLPLTALALANFMTSLNAIFHFYWHFSQFGRILDEIKWKVPTMVDLSIALGSLYFLLMTIAIARNRREYGWAMTWIPFIFSTCAAVSIGCIGWQIYRELKIAVMVIYGACFVLLCCIPFASCCCSSTQPGQSTSPVVANAKSRMGWAVPFVIIVLFPLIARLALEQLASNHSFTFDMRNYRNLFLHICILITYFQPIIVSIAAILFLPAYRSPLCCGQGPIPGKVIDSGYQKAVSAPVNQPSAPAVTTPAVVTSQPTSQGYPDPNLIAYLTNPSVNQMNHQKKAESSQVCPNSTVPQTTFVQQPMPQFVQQPVHCVAHQTVYQPVQQLQYLVPHMQPVVVGTPQHIMVQQPQMVRFASQPNLVQYSTLQNGASMPNMVTPQSPYYIQS